jgi:hypothetical protein
MTANYVGPDLCRIWCEVTAEFLRDPKAFRQSLEDDLSAVVSGAVSDSPDIALSRKNDVQDPRRGQNLLVDERSQQRCQDCTASDGGTDG